MTKSGKKCINDVMARYLPLLFSLLILFSCGQKITGYGVLLWENDLCDYQTGDIVKVISYSSVQNVYLVLDKDGKTRLEMPVGWLSFFENKNEAEEFAGHYLEKNTKMALSQRDGLPVRDNMSPNAGIIYKLQKNEVVKVLGISQKKYSIGNYEDRWYYLLTKSGTVGYTYGIYLTVFESGINPEDAAMEQKFDDPHLENLLTHKWRHYYFQEMINSGYYDFSRFRSEIGLFPDLEKQELVLRTDEYMKIFKYTDIKKLGYANYLFEGSDFRARVIRDDKISITYSYEGKPTTITYVYVPANIDTLIEEEREDRLSEYEIFSEKELKSSLYGSILFSETMDFEWKNYSRLVPGVIPGNAGSRGTIDFVYYRDASLKGEYDGVITFTFNNIPEKPLSFLYKEREAGVNLVFVKDYYIQDMVISRLGGSLLVLFFEFKES